MPDQPAADRSAAKLCDFGLVRFRDTVRIENAGDLTVATNLTRVDDDTFSAPATWVHLMASPRLVTRTAGDITVITNETQVDWIVENAQTYLDYLETELDAPVYAVGVGPSREETVVVESPCE